MRVIFLLALAVVAISAAPQKDVEVLKDERNVNDDGTYDHTFELSDGTKRTEKGILVDATAENGDRIKAIQVTGTFSYVSPEGQTITTNYVGDSNGFAPKGAHIPVPQ